METKEPYTRRTSRAVSQQNVDVVRGYFEVFNNWLASYWSDPERPLEESPGLDAVFARLDSEAELGLAA